MRGAHDAFVVPGLSGIRRRGGRGRGTCRRPALVFVVPSLTALAAPSGVNDGSTSGMVRPAIGAQLDGHHVVVDPAAVGESGGVTGDEPEVVRLRRRRDRQVEPQHVGLGRAGEVLEPGDPPGRDAGEQDRVQVRARLVVGRQVGEYARVEHRQQAGQFGPVHVLREPAVLVGGRAFHSSFSAIGIRTSLTSGLPRRETCCQGPVPTYLPCFGVPHPGLAAAGRGPDADHGTRRHRVGGQLAVAGELADRHLERDGVHVEGLDRVDPVHVRHRDQVRLVERAQRTEVEDAAEVDVECVGTLPGEHLAAAGSVCTAWRASAGVVRGAAGPDVDRWAGQVVARSAGCCRS